MSANLNSTMPYRAVAMPGYGHVVLLAGRVLMALLFVYFGYTKLTNFGGSVGYFTKWGFPAPQLTAGVAVLFELGFGLLLLAGWRARSMAWALALYVGIATAVAHRFWTYEAAQAFTETSFFFKNLAIVGGLLFIAGAGPGRYSLDRH